MSGKSSAAFGSWWRTRSAFGRAWRVFGFAVLTAGAVQAQAPELHKLTASDGGYQDQLGSSVSIDGDLIVAGAKLDDDGGTDAGAAYVYRFIGGTWVEEQKLTASDADAYDYFGKSVAVSGNRIVVGADQDDDAGNDAGASYVFLDNGSMCREERKLGASGGTDGDHSQ